MLYLTEHGPTAPGGNFAVVEPEGGGGGGGEVQDGAGLALPARVAHAAFALGVTSVEGTVLFFLGCECQCKEGLEKEESDEHGSSV